MKKILLLIILIQNLLFPQSGWLEQSSGTIQNLTSIFFIDANNGFIIGNAGTLLKTTDGGSSWNLQSLGTSVNLKSISFLDSFNGNIFGPVKTFYKTTDGGNSWINLSDSINYSFAAMSFLDLQNGISIQSTNRDTANIYKSTDGGLSWNYFSKVSNDNYFFVPSDIYYLGENTIATAGYRAFNAVVYQSTDGGISWAFRLSGGNSSSGIGYNKTQFINSTTGYLLANGGQTSMYRAYIYKTLNSGLSWVRVDNGELPLCRSIYMLDENNGYAVGNDQIYLGDAKPGAIYKTINGGVSWNQQANFTNTKLSNIYFVDSNNGIAVGDSGVIFKTTNGGVTFIEDEESNFAQPKEFLLQQNYPNPFNPSTKISWQSPISGWHSLKVYNVLGNEIATLVDEYKNAGSYEVEFKSTVGNRQLANGVYFYQLKAGDYLETKKMILLK